LAFGYLFASHPLFEDVFVTLCTLMSLGRSEIPPHIGKHIVLRDALACAVHIPEGGLAPSIPLLGGQFLESDGSISVEVMADALHPTERGYQIWADAVMPTFRELLGRN
jgi:hypothetical protein